MGRIAIAVVLLVLVAGCTDPSTPAGVEGRTATADYTVTLTTGCADGAAATPGGTTRPGATQTARTADRPDRSAGPTNGSASTPATDTGDCLG